MTSNKISQLVLFTATVTVMLLCCSLSLFSEARKTTACTFNSRRCNAQDEATPVFTGKRPHHIRRELLSEGPFPAKSHTTSYCWGICDDLNCVKACERRFVPPPLLPKKSLSSVGFLSERQFPAKSTTSYCLALCDDVNCVKACERRFITHPLLPNKSLSSVEFLSERQLPPRSTPTYCLGLCDDAKCFRTCQIKFDRRAY